MDTTAELSLTTLLNALQEFVWIRQPSGRMDFMNESAQAALGVGLSETEKDSRAYLQHIVPEDRDRVISAGCEAAERPVELEFRIQLPGADARVLRARVFPAPRPGGRSDRCHGDRPRYHGDAEVGAAAGAESVAG